MVKANHYLGNQAWNLPRSSHVDVIDPQNRINPIRIQSSDSILWLNTHVTQVKISIIWDSLRATGVAPQWICAV